jgi:hypothetical protein
MDFQLNIMGLLLLEVDTHLSIESPPIS